MIHSVPKEFSNKVERTLASSSHVNVLEDCLEESILEESLVPSGPREHRPKTGYK